jgi:acyl-CoA thioester hydrolase
MNNNKITSTTECQQSIIFADTDAGGMMYFGNAARFIEIGINNWFKENNFSYIQKKELNIFFVVRELQVFYNSVIKYDETIKIKTTIKYIGRFYLKFYVEILGIDNIKKIQANVKFVGINKTIQNTIKIPEELFSYRNNINNLLE